MNDPRQIQTAKGKRGEEAANGALAVTGRIIQESGVGLGGLLVEAVNAPARGRVVRLASSEAGQGVAAMLHRLASCLGLALCAGAAWSQQGVSMALDPCREIITNMPDPEAPSFYGALPTSNGMVRGAGWSGHVNAWFNYIKGGGGSAKYLKSRRAIEQAASRYEQALVAGAKKVAAARASPDFEREIRALNLKTSGKVLEYVKAYDARGADDVAMYAQLRAAQSDLKAVRDRLVVVQREYDVFVAELARANTEAEKKALFASASEVEGVLASAVEALRLTSQFVPLDPVSAVKSAADITVKVVPLLLGPGSGAVGRVDAKLAELDAKIEEHRRKAFTARITEASHQINAAQERLLNAARAISRNRLQMFDTLQQLAGIEPARAQPKYFGALWEYYKGAAVAGADLHAATRDYYEYLVRDRPGESALLLVHIQTDIEHVRRSNVADPTGGQWQDTARDAERWLRGMYIPWRNRDVSGASTCLRALKEFQHLRLADESAKYINDKVFNGLSEADYAKIGLGP